MKNLSPEERLYRFTTQTLNSGEDVNFNNEQLAFSWNGATNHIRKPRKLPDPTLPPTINKLLFQGAPYNKVNQKAIEAKIAKLRDEMDLPYDELYHKEKNMVDAIVQAE